MRTSPVPLVEKMVLFWHNHFVSGQDKLYDMGLLYTQNQLFRQHALGDYHALVQGMAIDPAMLWYLDNAENVAGREQENFAREVMELFTMGQGNYTEADVITMARAWTGHNVSDDRRSYQFRSSRHDTGLKELFGGPPTNWDGPATLTEILRGSRAVPRLGSSPPSSSRTSPTRCRSPIPWWRRSLTGSGPTTCRSCGSCERSSGRRPSGARPPAMRSCATPRSGSWRGWKPWGSRRACAIRSGRWRAPGSSSSTHRTSPAGSRTATGSPPRPAWARTGWGSYLRWQANDAGVFAGIETQSSAAIATQAFERFGIVDPSPTTRAALEAWVTRAKAEGHSWSIAPNLVLLLLASPDFQLA